MRLGWQPCSRDRSPGPRPLQGIEACEESGVLSRATNENAATDALVGCSASVHPPMAFKPPACRVDPPGHREGATRGRARRLCYRAPLDPSELRYIARPAQLQLGRGDIAAK